MSKKRICFVVTIPQPAIWFLRDHIERLSEEYDVFLVSGSPDPKDVGVLKLAGYEYVNIRRSISLIDDIKAVFRLSRYFNRMRFEAVHSLTPKAGLVTAVAGKISGVTYRIHSFTGQVWATRTGFMRKLLMLCDKVIARLDSHILVDGRGQQEYLIENKIIRRDKSCVLGAGSICGVNTQRFMPSAVTRDEVRAKIGIPSDAVVFAFLGRLNKDKGITELLTAYNDLVESRPDIYLLLIGMDDDNYESRFSNYPNLKPGENFCYFGLSGEPYNTLQAADVFVFPSYREGFGSSVIEASCLGLPVICSDIYGLKDAMVDDVTGLRCRVKDIENLEECMRLLYEDPALRKKLGQAGRERVVQQFSGAVITEEWVQFYKKLFMNDMH